MVEITLELQTRVGNRRKTFRDAAKGLQAISGDAISFDKLDVIIKRTLRLYLNEMALAQRQRHGRPWPGGTGSTSLSRRTGNLIESVKRSIKISGKFTQGGGEVRGQIGSPLIYASTQEFGATIRPKRAKYLTIPLPAAMDSRGVMLLPRARDYPNTFVAKSRKGNLLIFQKRGAKKIVPLFVLKREVKIPPRMNLGVMIEAGSRAFGDSVINEALREFNLGKI